MSFDFFEKHSDLECVYYDRDLKKLDRCFNECFEVFKSIKKRVERKETVKVAKSVFDFYNRQEMVTHNPQSVYNFHDDVVCITLEFNSKEDLYEVHSYGWNLPKSDFWMRPTSNVGTCSSDLKHGIMAYRKAVKLYIMEKFCELL